ncbi:MAG: uroporphyrinogen-III synthase [Rhodoluna sp.]
MREVGAPSVIDPYLKISLDTSEMAAKKARLMVETLEKSAGLTQTWLAITSVNSLKYFGELVGTDRIANAIKNSQLRFSAVGEASANELRNLGVSEILVPEKNTAKELAKAMIARGPAKVVWPRSAIAMKSFPNSLDQAGWVLIDGPVYETNPVQNEPESVKDLLSGSFAGVIFRSPSAAKAVAKWVAPDILSSADTQVICLGETTATAARELGFTNIQSNFKGAF